MVLSSRGFRLAVWRNETATCDCFFGYAATYAPIAKQFATLLLCSFFLLYVYPPRTFIEGGTPES